MNDADQAEVVAEWLTSGRTLLVVGTGMDAALASGVAARLAGTSVPVRPLTVDSATLTAIANDYGFEQVYARQVEALTHEGDVLLVISTGAPHDSLVNAARAAAACGAHVATVSGAERRATETHLDDVVESILARQQPAAPR